MKTLEFEARIIKIMKIKTNQMRIRQNHEINKIPYESYENHENPNIPQKHYENQEKLEIPIENQENQKNM